MSHKHYDLIVIGAGSGLNVASAAANQLDWNVALVENGPLGGTCLNRGCIPSKMIIHAADVAETIRHSHRFGIDSQINAIDFAAITTRASALVDEEAQQIEQNVLDHPKIDLYKTTGSFSATKTVQVGDQQITGDKILIAAGARPFIPPIPGLDTVDYWTSTEALRQTTQPKSLIIIGGGYIGMELGHFYGSLGTDITVIEAFDVLLSREDQEIAQTFTRLFSQKYNVFLGHRVLRVSQNEAGLKQVFFAKDGEAEQQVEAEAILVVTGTTPNTDTLNLENTTVQTTDRGYVITDEFMETTEKDIWALGDIVGKAPFKHGANYEAQIVLKNLQKPESAQADYTIIPHAVFSSPQIAGVGLTEEQAKEQGIAYEVRKKDYIKTGMGQAMLAEDSFVKCIVDPQENKILGCHIIGPEASTLIHEVVVAMTMAGGNISAITDTIHIHPALSEVVQRTMSTHT